MGNFPSSSATDGGEGRGGSSSSNNRNVSRTNATHSGGAGNPGGSEAFSHEVDSSAFAERSEASLSGNGGASRIEQSGRRILRMNSLSAGSSASSLRRLPHASDGILTFHDNHHSSAISVDAASTSTTGTNSTRTSVSSDSAPSGTSSRNLDSTIGSSLGSTSTDSDNESSADSSPMTTTGSGISGYLLSRFPLSFPSGRGGAGRSSFVSGSSTAAPGSEADELTSSEATASSWAEGQEIRAAPVVGSGREGFPRGVMGVSPGVMTANNGEKPE